MENDFENILSKLWIVSYCQNLTAADTFNEDTFEGPTQETKQTYGFFTEDEALKFYEKQKLSLKFAGCAGDYYTFPVTRHLKTDPRSNIAIACDTDDGASYRIWAPSKKEICPRCDGEGTHVNPNIDGHGISPEEFDEDPDFRESYFSGVYDIACELCNGAKIVRTPILESLPENIQEDYWRQVDAECVARRERESELRYGY